MARDHSQIKPLLSTSIAARLLLLIPVTIGLFVYALAVGYTDDVLVLMAIVGLGSVVLTITGSVQAILQGLDRMGAMSVATIVGRLVFVGGAVALLALGYSIYAVAAVAGLGSLVTLVFQAEALRRVLDEFGDTGSVNVDLASIRALLADSAPYFWITLFIALYLQVDTIVISLVVENDEVLGWYSVYDRLGGTLLFVPTVFMTAVYPTLSRLYDNSNDNSNNSSNDCSGDNSGSDDVGEGRSGTDAGDHNRLTQKTFELMLLISVPIGLGLLVVARPLVVLLFGEDFENAAPVIAVGGIVISLTYLTTVLGMFLISMDRQRQWTRFIALGAFLTIPLDFILVPIFDQRYQNGAIGGAFAYVVTETVILGGAIYLLPRGALGPSSLSYTFRVVAAGLVMAAAVLPFREEYLMVPIAVGVVVYGVMAMVLRLIAPEDKALVLSRLPTERLRSRSR